MKNKIESTEKPRFDAAGYQVNMKDLNGEVLPDLGKLHFRPFQHGGARAGAGRKPSGRKPVLLRLSPKLVASLCAHSGRLDSSSVQGAFWSELDKEGAGYNFCYMVTETKSRKLGNSLGAIIPKEVAARLNVEEGSSLYFTEAPDGVRLTAGDPDFGRKMKAAESLGRRYRNALRELAK